MHLRYCYAILFIVAASVNVSAQLIDNFSNDHLFANLEWEGTTDFFVYNAAEIQSQGSSTQLNFSYLPLLISSVSVSGENKLLITFNQELEETSAETTVNYFLSDGFGNPVTAVRDTDDGSTVTLEFEESFFNSTYLITISGVKNASDNDVAEALSFEVQIAKPTGADALLITEIFADPNTKGTPPDTPVFPTASDAEFVEIFNASSHTIDLTGFRLSGGTISAAQIGPGEYLILVRGNFAEAYAAFGKVASVSSWNTLTNSGEQILLNDQFGNLIDEVTFSSSWLRNSQKNGGWSIEKINPAPVCDSDENWTASLDPKGATPGAQNSTFNDEVETVPPNIQKLDVQGPQTISVTFTEKMNEESLTSGVISGEELVIDSRELISDRELRLQLAMPMESGNSYELVLENFADCSGNVALHISRVFYYDTEPPVPQRVVLRSFNSLLLSFDEPLNKTLAEKEENYSAGPNNQQPKKATLPQDTVVLLEFDADFLVNTDYELSIVSLADTAGNTMTDPFLLFFSAKQQIDSVWAEGPNFLSITFASEVEPGTLTDPENFILENQKPEAIVQLSPTQARLIFGKNFVENKNLTLWTSGIKNASGEFLSTPAYQFIYDTKAPTVLSVDATNHNQLQVQFSEKVTAVSAENLLGYSLSENGRPIKAELEQDSLVHLEFAESFPLEQELQLGVSTVRDYYGNEMKTTAKKAFVYDTLAPGVLEVKVFAPNLVKVVFSEPVTGSTASELANYTLSSSQPSVAFRPLPDSSSVLLEFPVAVPEHPVLEIQHLDDFRGNKMAHTSISFSNAGLIPGRVIVHAENIIEACFNKNLASAGRENVTAPFAIHSAGLGAFTNCVLITTEEELENGAAYTLKFSGLTSTGKEPLGLSDSIIFHYSSFVEKLRSNDPSFLELRFTVPLNTDSLANTTKFQLIPGEIRPAFFAADSEDSSLVRLFFDVPLAENEPFELSMNQVYDRWNRKLPDQGIPFTIDRERPSVDTVYTRRLSEIVVTFSESLDTHTALAPNHYQLVGENIPSQISFLQQEPGALLLVYSKPFENGKSYQLVVQRVEDAAGNTMETDTIAFVYHTPDVPEQGEILITEIMADPSPAVGLPETEYVELYNNTARPLDLSTVSFSDDSRTLQLDGVIKPGAYIVLCPLQNATSLSHKGQVLGIGNWPALSNSGDSLTLTNLFGEVVDRAVYRQSWYKDTSKDDGGYSLERIFEQPLCDEAANWRASLAENGGTPGDVNSVWHLPGDGVPPRLLGAEVKSDSVFTLNFSEPLDTSSLKPENFSISPLLRVKTQNAEDGNITFALAEKLDAQQVYVIEATGLRDCYGNTIAHEHTLFAMGEAVSAGDVIFTEVMADPAPSAGLPEQEYVEILNRSAKLLNLAQLNFSDEGTSVLLSGILKPGEYLLLASASGFVFPDSLPVLYLQRFPSITNSGERLSLTDTSGLLVDQLNFDLSWYKDTGKDDGGYSLERINLLQNCSGFANWSASVAAVGGTPGTVNSLNNTAADTVPPDLLQATVSSATELKLTFSEGLETSLLAAATFEIVGGPLVHSVLPDDTHKDQLTLALQPALEKGKTYRLRIKNIPDCQGNMLLADSTDLGLGRAPNFGDVLFTEIMADPEPSVGLPESEYLEIANASNEWITTEGLQLRTRAYAIQLPAVTLAPGEYLILTSTSNASLFNEFGRVTGVPSFPTLLNDEGVLDLYESDLLIHSVAYSSAMIDEVGKAGGGWSLEIIDPALPCANEGNWAVSVNPAGGTPGKENSVSATLGDGFAPVVQEVIAESDSVLHVMLSEPVNFKNQSIQASLTPTIDIGRIHAGKDVAPSFQVFLKSKLQHDLSYQLSLSGLVDCAGNIADRIIARFVLPEEADSLDIIVNEILFNPRAGGVDFVELVNKSAKYINLKAWSIGNVNAASGDPANWTKIAEGHLLVEPGGFVVLTGSPQILKGDYPRGDETTFVKTALPSYPQAAGGVALANPGGNLMDRFDYREDLHSPFLTEVKGVSLERISTETATNDPANWVSAAASHNFATPGYRNSRSITPAVVENQVKVEPRALIAGESLASIYFAPSLANSRMDARLYDLHGRLVKTLAEGKTVGESSFLQWDGTSDQGQLVRTGVYILQLDFFNADGQREVTRSSIAVAGRF